MACLGLLRRLSAGAYEYDKMCLKRLTSVVILHDNGHVQEGLEEWTLFR